MYNCFQIYEFGKPFLFGNVPKNCYTVGKDSPYPTDTEMGSTECFVCVCGGERVGRGERERDHLTISPNEHFMF